MVCVDTIFTPRLLESRRLRVIVSATESVMRFCVTPAVNVATPPPVELPDDTRVTLRPSCVTMFLYWSRACSVTVMLVSTIPSKGGKITIDVVTPVKSDIK